MLPVHALHMVASILEIEECMHMLLYYIEFSGLAKSTRGLILRQVHSLSNVNFLT